VFDQTSARWRVGVEKKGAGSDRGSTKSVPCRGRWLIALRWKSSGSRIQRRQAGRSFRSCHCKRSGSFSQPPPTPTTMASTSQPPKGRDVVLPTLDVFIQALNIAKDACGIPPAQIALGSASTLLTMIRVRSPLLREDYPPTHFYQGHDGQL
jgi:hypothetical protein